MKTKLQNKITLQIDDAVRVFRESLEIMYLKKNKELYGVGLFSLEGFFSGKINIQRLKSGNLRMSGEVSKLAINEKCIGLPMKPEDWDIKPIVVTLHNKDFRGTQ